MTIEKQNLSDNARALELWFATELGQSLLANQRSCIKTAMSGVFGVRYVEVGLAPGLCCMPRHPGWQQSLAVPYWSEHLYDYTGHSLMVARPEELPIADGSLDAVVLHHTLDIAGSPQRALREASRVVRSGGHVIVVGFNPFGIWGIRRLLSSRQRMPWRARFLSAWRVQDWLGLLECTVAPPRFGFFRPPVQNGRLLRRLSTLEPFYERGIQLPFGGFYTVIAEKREEARIGTGPRWQREKVVSMPVANRSTARGALKLNCNETQKRHE